MLVSLTSLQPIKHLFIYMPHLVIFFSLEDLPTVFYAQVNPLHMKFDVDTLIWLNAFLLNLMTNLVSLFLQFASVSAFFTIVNINKAIEKAPMDAIYNEKEALPFAPTWQFLPHRFSCTLFQQSLFYEPDEVLEQQTPPPLFCRAEALMPRVSSLFTLFLTIK